jgi:hypothetical protein
MQATHQMHAPWCLICTRALYTRDHMYIGELHLVAWCFSLCAACVCMHPIHHSTSYTSLFNPYMLSLFPLNIEQIVFTAYTYSHQNRAQKHSRYQSTASANLLPTRNRVSSKASSRKSRWIADFRMPSAVATTLINSTTPSNTRSWARKAATRFPRWRRSPKRRNQTKRARRTARLLVRNRTRSQRLLLLRCLPTKRL